MKSCQAGEAYYGDSLFDTLSLDVLLSNEYAAKRRALIGKEASREMRPSNVGEVSRPNATLNVAADK